VPVASESRAPPAAFDEPVDVSVRLAVRGEVAGTVLAAAKVHLQGAVNVGVGGAATTDGDPLMLVVVVVVLGAEDGVQVHVVQLEVEHAAVVPHAGQNRRLA